MVLNSFKKDSKIKYEKLEIQRRKAKRCNCLLNSNVTIPKTIKITKTFLIGVIIGLIGICIIYVNEVKFIDYTIHYNKAIINVIELDSNRYTNDYNGQLVYLHGRLQLDEPLTEPEYGVSIQCVKLKQRVQMFQWTEKIVNNQEIYEGEWKSKIINSEKFKLNETYKNPLSFPMETKTFVNEGVRIGEYYLSDEFKHEFNDYTQITGDDRPDDKNIKMHFGLYYHSRNVWVPEIGDMRVQFSYAGLHDDEITVVGKKVDQFIHPFYNISPGYHVKYINIGSKKSLPDMLYGGHKNNIWVARCFRIFAVILLYLSAHLILQNFTEVFFKLFVSISTAAFITAYIWYWNYPTFSRKIMVSAVLGPLLVSTFFGKKYKIHIKKTVKRMF